jgi:hypothetical protein
MGSLSNRISMSLGRSTRKKTKSGLEQIIGGGLRRWMAELSGW